MSSETNYPIPTINGDKNLIRFYRTAMQMFAAGSSTEEIVASTPFSLEEINYWIEHRWGTRHTKQVDALAQERIQLSSDRIVEVVNDTLALLEQEVKKYRKASAETDMPVMKPEQLNSVVKTAKGLYEMLEMKEDKDAERERKLNNVKTARITSVNDFAKLLQEVDPNIDYSSIIES